MANQNWFYKQKVTVANQSSCMVRIRLVDQSKLRLDTCVSFRFLPGLSKQPKLSWLSLAGNQLSSLDTGILEKLPLLRYLSVQNNEITHLRGLQVSVFYNFVPFSEDFKLTFTCYYMDWKLQNSRM